VFWVLGLIENHFVHRRCKNEHKQSASSKSQQSNKFMFQENFDEIITADNNSELRTQNSELRILLWDIDGTLINSNSSGAFKEYFAPSLEKIFGTSGTLDSMTISGMTDIEIAMKSLCNEGITLEHINNKLSEWLYIYQSEMRRVIDEGHSWNVLSGIREILSATQNHPRFINTLLTGNIYEGAKMKLESVGLWNFFHPSGAFGEDSHDRKNLPALAAERIKKELKIDLQPSQFIVIGDTPNDIACARHFGARAVAVATGRLNPPENLIQHKPDILLMSLENTKEVLKILETI